MYSLAALLRAKHPTRNQVRSRNPGCPDLQFGNPWTYNFWYCLNKPIARITNFIPGKPQPFQHGFSSLCQVFSWHRLEKTHVKFLTKTQGTGFRKEGLCWSHSYLRLISTPPPLILSMLLSCPTLTSFPLLTRGSSAASIGQCRSSSLCCLLVGRGGEIFLSVHLQHPSQALWHQGWCQTRLGCNSIFFFSHQLCPASASKSLFLMPKSCPNRVWIHMEIGCIFTFSFLF